MNEFVSGKNDQGSDKRVAGVKKIAVVRANALGDFLLALPALEALRAAYPRTEMVLLAKAWHAQFLAKRPGPVDRVVVVPAYGGVGEAPGITEDQEAITRFFAEMQREHFDLAIQMHGGGGYSNPFVQRLGARFTLGLRAPEAGALDRWVPYTYYQPEIARYLEVVSLVGATPITLEPRVIVTEQDLAEAFQVVPETRKPLIALHPGASDSRRHWPSEKFAAVGDALAATGAQVVVTGTQEEKPIVAAVINAMRAKALDLGGRLSLKGLTGLLARCALVIANDTGPMHLASAVGTPTIGLYWVGNLITAGHLTRSNHHPMISWQLACPVCGQDNTQARCQHEVSFVDAISAEEVIAASLEILSSTNPKNPVGVSKQL